MALGYCWVTMGLFDIFSGKSSLEKHAAKIANKRTQAMDRMESIYAVGKLKTSEAAVALLARYNYQIDPSITDHEEKETVMRFLVEAKDASLGPTLDYLRNKEAVTWPIKVLVTLRGERQVAEEILKILQDMDTEYERDPQKKIQLLQWIEEKGPEVLDNQEQVALCREGIKFMDDINETVRFHALAIVEGQISKHPVLHDDAKKAMEALMHKEESMRIKMQVLKLFGKLGWVLSGREAMKLPAKVGFTPDGVPQLSE